MGVSNIRVSKKSSSSSIGRGKGSRKKRSSGKTTADGTEAAVERNKLNRMNEWGFGLDRDCSRGDEDEPSHKPHYAWPIHNFNIAGNSGADDGGGGKHSKEPLATCSDVENLRRQIDATSSDLILRLREIETGLEEQLELEEMSQSSFKQIQGEMAQLQGRVGDEVNKIKGGVSRTVDTMTMALHELRRDVDESRMTSEKRSALRSDIEREVIQTIAQTMQNELRREVDNVKLTVQTELLKREKMEVVHSKTVSDLEKVIMKQEKTIHELVGKVARMEAMYPDESEGPSKAPVHRLNVLEFAHKGLVGRMNDLENDSAVIKEKVSDRIEVGRKEMEVFAEKTKAEMNDVSHEQRLKLKNMLSEVTLTLQDKMTEFTDNILVKGRENNEEAMREVVSVKGAFKKSEEFVSRCVRSFESKIGRVVIDFDRLSGDTNAVCEALACGLQEVRKGIENQKRYLVDFTNEQKRVANNGGQYAAVFQRKHEHHHHRYNDKYAQSYA